VKARQGVVTRYSSQDSPALPLSGGAGTQQTRTMSATDYVMFKPNNGVKAVWVAVSQSTWNWAVSATKTGSGDNAWTLSGVVQIARQSNLSPASSEPTYGKRIEGAV